MIISLPDKLSFEKSEKHIMSIRIQPDGLSFSVYEPGVRDSFSYQQIRFDNHLPYINNLKECFFLNDLLAWPYKKIRVLIESPFYTFVPETFFDPKRQQEVFNFNFPLSSQHLLNTSFPSQGCHMIYGVQEDIYEFCARSIIHPEFSHHLEPLIRNFQIHSRSGKVNTMYVVMNQKSVDLLIFQKGRLLFANAFAFNEQADLLYYILYVWSKNDMKQLHDQLFIMGDASARNDLMQSLNTYINNAYPVEIPSEAYLIGGNILKAPLDLILLSICE